MLNFRVVEKEMTKGGREERKRKRKKMQKGVNEPIHGGVNQNSTQLVPTSPVWIKRLKNIV